MPFEAIVEILSENSDIDSILDIYSMGEPNTNHIFIAMLAKTHLIKTIVTTNFDSLIEKALINAELKEDRDFKVYYLEDHFSNSNKLWDELASDNDDIIRVFKIHGSIVDKNSIRATMKAVANQSLSDKRLNIIQHLFSTGTHDTVLVLGYSCSDVFDITPSIKRLNKDKKRGYQNIGTIYFNQRNFIMAIEYYEKSLKINLEIGDKNLESVCYENQGNAYLMLNDLNKSLEYQEKSLKIARDIGDIRLESACYGNRGSTYLILYNFNKAIEYYDKSLKIAEDIGDIRGESRGYAGLSISYYMLCDFNKGIEYSEKSLKIAIDIGDKLGELKCYEGLGIAFILALLRLPGNRPRICGRYRRNSGMCPS